MGSLSLPALGTKAGLHNPAHASTLDHATLMGLMGGQATLSPLDQIQGAAVPLLDTSLLPVHFKYQQSDLLRMNVILQSMPNIVQLLGEGFESGYLKAAEIQSLIMLSDPFEISRCALSLMNQHLKGLACEACNLIETMESQLVHQLSDVKQVGAIKSIAQWMRSNNDENLTVVVADRACGDEFQEDGVGYALRVGHSFGVIDVDLRSWLDHLSPLHLLAFELIDFLSLRAGLAPFSYVAEMGAGFYGDFSELQNDVKFLRFFVRVRSRHEIRNPELFWQRMMKIIASRFPDLLEEMDYAEDEETLMADLVHYMESFMPYLAICAEIKAMRESFSSEQLPDFFKSERDGVSVRDALESFKAAALTLEGGDDVRTILTIVLDHLLSHGFGEAPVPTRWSDSVAHQYLLVDSAAIQSGRMDQFAEEFMSGEVEDEYDRLVSGAMLQQLVERGIARNCIAALAQI